MLYQNTQFLPVFFDKSGFSLMGNTRVNSRNDYVMMTAP